MKHVTSMTAKVVRYLAFRHSLGYQLKSEGNALADFARYVDHLGHRGSLTLALALEWARLPAEADPSYWARRLATVRGLARYLQLEDPQTEVPPLRLLGPAGRRRIPHIYSAAEISQLMDQARGTPEDQGLQPLTLYTVIGLLASTGLRISEALHLQVNDVDLKHHLLTVRESKFHKSRLLPLHATVVAKLAQYHQRCQGNFPGAQSFFVSSRGTPLTYGTIQHAFHKLVKDLPCRGERAHPRLHDLRHTYACQILTRWSKRPRLLDQRVLWLMHYLGHTHISHTYWYLSAVPELLAQAARHFEHYSQRSMA